MRNITNDISDGTSYAIVLERLLSLAPSKLPHELFKDVSDDFWLWLNTEGYRTSAELRELLPALPPEYFQLAVSGVAGDETLKQAFSVYKLLRTIIEKRYKHICDCSAVLDFGCGWGRIMRFFLKDVPGCNLWGVDQWDELVQLGKETNKWSHFLSVGQEPPTAFSDGQFDVVFSYSVFSHLAEETHKRWLAEFKRITKPGGLLIVTTWSRDQISFLDLVSKGQATAWEDHYNKMVGERFPGTEKAFGDYDNGKFFHIDLDYATYPGYGETCIPMEYVLREWGPSFAVLDYIDDRALCSQNVVVARKGTGSS